MDEDQKAEQAVEAQEIANSQTEAQDQSTEDSTDWKAEAEKWRAEADKKEHAFQDQKRRAEKAEKRPTATKAETPVLNTKDILALSSAGVTEDEDYELVERGAALKGITLAQAIKDPMISSLLKGQREARQTAIATTTGNTRRAPNSRTPQDLLASARNGQLPDSKDDVRKLIRAKLGLER